MDNSDGPTRATIDFDSPQQLYHLLLCPLCKDRVDSVSLDVQEHVSRFSSSSKPTHYTYKAQIRCRSHGDVLLQGNLKEGR